jgi:hypothetical protein
MPSPDNVRISNRKKKLRAIWRSPEWKKGVKEFVKDKKCQWCGSTTKLTAHHPHYQRSDEVYLDLYLSSCLVLCNRCHFSIHKGLQLCPVCGVHYMRVGADRCYHCFVLNNPDIAEKIQIKRESMKQLKKELTKKFRDRLKSSDIDPS